MVLDKGKEKNFKIFFYCAQFSLIQMFSLNIYSYNITLKKKKRKFIGKKFLPKSENYPDLTPLLTTLEAKIREELGLTFRRELN